MHSGIMLITGWYDNGLRGERRMVFLCENYYLLPSGLDRRDGTYVLRVGTGERPTTEGLKFAGQYGDREEMTMAMLMMLGSHELRHGHGAFVVATEDLVSFLSLKSGFTRAGHNVNLSSAPNKF